MLTRTRLRVALVISCLLAACAPAPPTHTPSAVQSPSLPPAVPSGSEPIDQLWIPEAIDPAPGPTVTGGIAEALGGPADQVVAAVFLLSHPAGNGAGVWVFRAGDLTSEEALAGWVASQPQCAVAPEHGVLAGRETVVIRARFIDQCQPQYLVQFDERTAVVITDDGGYAGNGSDEPTVPYRPAADIAWIVRWLDRELTKVELLPGGPPLNQG